MIYFIGSTVLAFAVVMMKRSNIGLSSWDTLHFSLHSLLGITLGTAVFFVALTLTIFVTVMNKQPKYLLMLIPVSYVSSIIDLFDLNLLADFIPVALLPRILAYTTGLLLLPLGGSMLIISSFPAGVFDEVMITIMRILKTNKLIQVRVIMEITVVALAIVIGLIAGIGLGMVNIGTLIFTLSIGTFLKLYLKLFEKIGMYEIEPIN